MGPQSVILTLLTVVGAALGFTRDLVTAAVYATTPAADAFTTALIYVEGIAAVMAYGVASQVLVPLLLRHAQPGATRDREIVSGLLAWIVCLGTPLAVASAVEPAWVIALVAPKFSPAQAEALVPLVRGFMPTAMLVAASGVAVGALRARADFYVPVLGRGLFNLATALLLVVFASASSTRVGAWALFAGASVQFGVQLWRLHALGWTWPRPRMFDTELGQVFGAVWPILVALAATNLLMLGPQRAIVSDLPGGAFAANGYALRLLNIATLVSVTLSTVAATDFAQRYYATGVSGLGERLVAYVQPLSILLAPASVVLLAMSHPLVDVAFHRGRFSAGAVDDTAAAMRVFAIAILPGGLVTIANMLFTSIERPMTFLATSLTQVTVTLLLTLLLRNVLGVMVLEGAFVGGVVAACAAAAVGISRVIGTSAVGAVASYLASLTLRVALAVAVGSSVLLVWHGRAPAVTWLAGGTSTSESVVAAMFFVGAFFGLSWIARDRGLTMLVETLASVGQTVVRRTRIPPGS